MELDNELFPYQKIGGDWLSTRKTALLADDMGLGKSAQVVTACDKINARRILVLCPASARVNWVREFEKFSIHARTAQVIQGRKIPTEPAGITVCSYDLASELLASNPQPFDVLVLDECHFLKSLGTKRTRAVYGKEGLVRRAARTWALSGTPAPNHPAELWPLLFTFGVTRLSYDQFIDRFCTSYLGPHGPQITGAKEENIPELRAILSNTMLRRKKEDVMQQLPPIFYSDVVVEPGPVDLEIEASFAHYFFPDDRRLELQQKLVREKRLLETTFSEDGGVNIYSGDGLKALEAMATSVATIRRYIGLQKVKAVVDMVTEQLVLGKMEKVVIFAIHRDVIENLRVKLAPFKPVTLYGGTEPSVRQKNIDKFQKNPKCCVFIGNILAAGTAITLTAAHHVIFIEQDWVPGNNAQAAMRCHRIGQNRPVFVRFVGLVDSIDSKVSQVLKRKARQLTKIFDDRQLPESKRDDTRPSPLEFEKAPSVEV